MADCLILVERNVSKPDIIHHMLRKSMEKYFDKLVRSPIRVKKSLLRPPISYLPNYGMAGTISLTSIVLATSLLQDGVDAYVLDDDNVLETYKDDLTRIISDCNVVAVSTTYIVIKKSLAQIVSAIRDISKDVPILLGGQGIPSLALDPFSDEDGEIFNDVNAVMYGDAEEIFAELVKDFRDGKSSNRNLPGVLYNRDGRWEGSQTPVAVDLDAVPIPNYQVLEKCDVNAGRFGNSIQLASGALEEGRGCKFRCRFCSYHLYSSFRRKSPERIVAEMMSIKKLGYNTAAFVGAEFLSPAKHSSRVLDAIIKAKLDMNSWIYGRLDYLSRNPELLPKVSDAGISNIVFGMESGDEGQLKRMGKYYDVEKMVRGARDAKLRNITLTASIIIGFPGETDETIENTTKILCNSDFHYVFLHALSVVPFTPLWRLRESMGLNVGKTGYWAHKTMALHMVPEIAKKMILKINDASDSLFVNVKRNLAVPFLRPDEESRLDPLAKIMQNILSNEWSANPNQDLRLTFWDSFQGVATQLPEYAMSKLDVLK